MGRLRGYGGTLCGFMMAPCVIMGDLAWFWGTLRGSGNLARAPVLYCVQYRAGLREELDRSC